MKRIILLFLISIIVGCDSYEHKARSSEQVSKLDTNKMFSNSINHEMGFDSADNIIEIDTNEYRLEKKIDTTYTFGSDVFSLHVVSKFDSSKTIILPKKYLELVKINRFSVFETNFRVLLKRNSKLIIDTILSKSNFKHLSDSTLQKYGVLQFPNLQVYRDSLIIEFSYSIPLSDVGVYAPITLKLYE